MNIKQLYSNDKFAVSTDEIDTVFLNNIAEDTALSIQIQDGYFSTIYSEDSVALNSVNVGREVEIVDQNETTEDLDEDKDLSEESTGEEAACPF